MGGLRRPVLTLLAIAGSAACTLFVDTGDLGGAPLADAVDASLDSGVDALSAEGGASRCDPSRPFATPTVLSLSTSVEEGNPRLSADERTIVFGRSSGTTASSDIYIASRPSVDAPFAPAAPLAEATSSSADLAPALAEDGLTLVFASIRSGGPGRNDLYRIARTSIASAFGAPAALPAPINGASADTDPFLVGGELWFASDRGQDGNMDIYRASSVAATSVERVAELASPQRDGDPTVSADGLTIFFASDRTGGMGGTDIWMARRSSVMAPFDAPSLVAELSSTLDDAPGWMSPDGCRVYFASSRPGGPGGSDLYVAERPR